MAVEARTSIGREEEPTRVCLPSPTRPPPRPLNHVAGKPPNRCRFLRQIRRQGHSTTKVGQERRAAGWGDDEERWPWEETGLPGAPPLRSVSVKLADHATRSSLAACLSPTTLGLVSTLVERGGEGERGAAGEIAEAGLPV
ncbi:hypothetical protein [Oryza sativa Japonica Group]|jgi:hypothetical protein|uniref:Uncharacterized protein n=2 Tax=Oryza sativa subsp. japonica TaxID=39947 RepID=Q7F2T3_ORYSJ|nr:hypothetical protein OsJ_19895 [Oryza sativa Japonica Group]BAB85283.1 hypothetical protein [Oryza sativa Japonica Group]BAB93378.1 hypothetical protein [Oryza sativa Japonica Group]BAS74966.1 Os01g0820100 [Oryza sativa Japonica Group]